jgi:hypothetical protein
MKEHPLRMIKLDRNMSGWINQNSLPHLIDFNFKPKLQTLYTFLYWYGVGPPIAFNAAAILFGMDSYKFWTVSRRVLYHSSYITSSSCFRNFGGGNLFLILVSKTEQSGSVMFRMWWLCWPGKMLKFTFMLFRLWLNSSSCVNGGIVVMKNCIVRK